MRETVVCPNEQEYLKNPKAFLPTIPACLNNPAHRPYWNTHWEKRFCPDHVHAIWITIFNAYCEECHETISYWPEFALPYQREPLETYEQALIEHLQGTRTSEIAARIGYDPRTVSRWIRLILTQSMVIIDPAIRRILSLIVIEALPLSTTNAKETASLLLAWLRRLAETVRFPRLNRLMGLCNLIAEGKWDLWGAVLGKAKSRVNRAPAPG